MILNNKESQELLLANTDIAAHLATMNLVGAAARMVYGMSAHGGTDVSPAFAALHDVMEKARAKTWPPFWGVEIDDGIRNLLTLWDDNGESRTDYFSYRTWLDSGLDEIAAYEMDRINKDDNTEAWDEMIQSRLPVMLGVGPCQCSHCMNDWDCCGNMVAYSVEAWPANEAHTLWYGKLYSSRNI